MEFYVIFLIGVGLILTFGIGAQDETLSTTYASGSLRLRPAMILGAILGFIGVTFLSGNVGQTIGEDLLGEAVEYDIKMMLAVLIGTASWLLLASRRQVPISTTHTVVGAVFGISFVWAIATGKSYLTSINWFNMGKVFLGWIISPLLGYLGAMLGQYLVKRYFSTRSAGLAVVENHEQRFRYLIIFFAAINQIGRAGNDSGNALGIFYGLFRIGTINSLHLQLLTIIAAGLFALGLFFIGRNLVKNVGNAGGKLRPSEALAIEASTSLIIFAATLLGLPVSGGHILIFSILGSARFRGESPDRKSFRDMLVSWLITFPIAALLSSVSYGLILILTTNIS